MPFILSKHASDAMCSMKIKQDRYIDWQEQQCNIAPSAHPPAVMSAQPPAELALAAKAVCGLLIHQPPALFCPQFLLELQSVWLLPQSIFVPNVIQKSQTHGRYSMPS